MSRKTRIKAKIARERKRLIKKILQKIEWKCTQVLDDKVCGHHNIGRLYSCFACKMSLPPEVMGKFIELAGKHGIRYDLYL